MESEHTASNAQKKGAAELLVMAQLEAGDKHGYAISQDIDTRSGGVVTFNVASLYPILYGLEERGLIKGRWVEKAGQRRRRYYRLTAKGHRKLASQRESWSAFFSALRRAGGIEYA